MAWNDAVITNSGLALLSEVIGGKTLNISAAKVGEGTVQASALMAQTSISGVLDDVSVAIAAVNNFTEGIGKQIRLQIRNTGLSVAKKIQQIGLFAHLDGEEDVLFAIMQDDAGENIPTEEEYPDCLIEFTAAVALSQTEGITVTLSGSAVITQQELDAAIAELKKELPTPISFTITTNNWTASDDVTYPYKAIVTNTAITASDMVEAAFSLDTLAVAQKAGIAAAGVTVSGGFEVYSKKIPTDTVSGTYYIVKGA